MPAIHKAIVHAEYTSGTHDHAMITIEGESRPYMIGKTTHPLEWSEMHRSVVLKHYTAPVAQTLPPIPLSSTPVPSPVPPPLPAPPPQAALPAPPMSSEIESMRARLAELEAQRPGSTLDLDALIDSMVQVLGPRLSETAARVEAVERVLKDVVA